MHTSHFLHIVAGYLSLVVMIICLRLLITLRRYNKWCERQPKPDHRTDAQLVNDFLNS